jgi:hypothetical protein
MIQASKRMDIERYERMIKYALRDFQRNLDSKDFTFCEMDINDIKEYLEKLNSLYKSLPEKITAQNI